MATGLIIASPGSGHGKTLVTAGLVHALLRRGRSVRLFKMGPDYLDPQFLEQATGLAVRQLDYWMLGAEGIAEELRRADQSADHVIVEGMMGLFDGSYPVAKLAEEFNLPVVVVADASAMAQTFGALMLGLAQYDPSVSVAAVIANKVGSPGHGEMLRDSVRAPQEFLTWVQRSTSLEVLERHLGIDTQSRQVVQDSAQLMAEMLDDCADRLPWREVRLASGFENGDKRQLMKGRRIAIARDAAFNFLYRANLDFLERQGAQLQFFSPLHDKKMPDSDALYLPGGYPELHLELLGENRGMAASIRAHIEADRPCVAECGGMLYLLDHLAFGERQADMLGVLSGTAEVKSKLAAIGYQQLPGTKLRGHSFHHAVLNGPDTKERAHTPTGGDGEAIYRYRRTVASFVHWYFSSDPATVASWFGAGD